VSGRRGSAWILAGSLSRRFSGPRATALSRLIHDAGLVITGRGPRRKVVAGEPAIDPRLELRLRDLSAAGNLAAAAAVAERILADHPDHLRALDARLQYELAQGELTSALATIESIRAIVPAHPATELEDDVVARLVTSDPRWSPRIPGPPSPADESGAAGPILELDDDTLLDGIGPDVPLSEALATAAWLADCQAREIRASAIHVTPGPGRIGALQVGLAVHDHTGLALRVDPYRDDPSLPADSELARRRRAVAERVTQAAEHPATSAEGRGAPP
jgi:hypothetical protein